MLSKQKLILSKDVPILINLERPANETASFRGEFLQQAQGEVNQCPFGVVGISQLRVKGAKDHYRSSEIMEFLYKIDNSNCTCRVKSVDFKLIRILKFR